MRSSTATAKTAAGPVSGKASGDARSVAAERGRASEWPERIIARCSFAASSADIPKRAPWSRVSPFARMRLSASSSSMVIGMVAKIAQALESVSLPS